MTPTEHWRERLGRIAREIGGELDRASRSLGIGVPAEYEIVAYRGYAGGSRVLVQGRAQEAKQIPPATAADSLWRNLLNTYKRIDADPLPGAHVRVTVAGVEREVVADDEGFMREWIDLPAPLSPDAPWQPVELQLLAPLRPGHPDVRARGEVRVLTGVPTFGVISDLDDTVIQSRITSFLQAVRTVMLGNARTRLPFPGVAAFYRALERGGDGARLNPIFYVSSSPWNIHDIIADFMDIQQIPRGSISLRDWDIVLSALTSSRLGNFKEPVIREIMDLYPALPFILIGDNSQKDPEIYRAILDRYPGRILAIYIRNVDANPERSASVQALAKEVLAAGSTLIIADDTYAAAQHAVEQGWITKESLPAIREEKKADEGTTGTKADVPGVPEEKAAPTIVVE
ncbi:MAG TPA: phosphatase domain-containing protein [Gemmatimonadaceae bacterium]|nr:phosphatase domain-containing protein [Gemmatimonadaceae bacterium]